MSQSPLKWTDSPTSMMGAPALIYNGLSQSPLKWTDSPTWEIFDTDVMNLGILSQSPLKWTDSPTNSCKNSGL